MVAKLTLVHEELDSHKLREEHFYIT